MNPDHECSRCGVRYNLSALNTTVRRYVAQPWFNHVELRCHRGGCGQIDRRFYSDDELAYARHARNAPEFRAEMASAEVMRDSFRQRGPIGLNIHSPTSQEIMLIRDFRAALDAALWPAWLPWAPPEPPPTNPGAGEWRDDA